MSAPSFRRFFSRRRQKPVSFDTGRSFRLIAADMLRGFEGWPLPTAFLSVFSDFTPPAPYPFSPLHHPPFSRVHTTAVFT